MSQLPPQSPSPWTDGILPSNVQVGVNTIITGQTAFRRFLSEQQPALVLGANGTMHGVQFAIGRRGRIEIGEFCYFNDTVLLCELELRIGSYVAIGFNTVIADSDFHPIDPAERIADAIACSPLAGGRQRPPIECRPVIIEDDVWIGPSVTILKGVRIGAGAVIEPGTVITRDVPAGRRAMGNPAQLI